MGSMLYLDCSSGAAGDMLLGALIDLGVSIDALRDVLKSALPPGCSLEATKVQRSGITATHFRVVEPPPSGDGAHGHTHRHLSHILRLIDTMALSPAAREKASSLFQRLGTVEAGIHGIPIERVHFHEVGALDSIVDIVGTVWALEQLQIDNIVSSPLTVGSGTVETEHGRLPVPAPATLQLLEGVPIVAGAVPMEMVTPTGALLVSGYASAFGPMPPMTLRRIGYGAGTREIKGQPNVLRAVLGESAATASASAVAVCVLECNIDDMNPQVYGYLIERLYAIGALEVFYTPVTMKKSRPGTLVTVIVPPAAKSAALDVLFSETTTIGVRHQELHRECLDREWVTVSTPFGAVRIKIAKRGARVTNATPEFEDCATLAVDRGVPVKAVQAAASLAYAQHSQGDRTDVV